MNKYLKISVTLFVLLMGFISLTTSSCKKEAKGCVGEVTVYDSTNVILKDAAVSADFVVDNEDSTKVRTITKKTDTLGQVTFEIRYPGVYTVTAVHPQFKNKYARGVLILNEPGSTDTEVIEF